MPSLTEITLFKACVDQPRIAHLSSLNLTNIQMFMTSPINDDVNNENTEAEAILKKKAIKLYYMMWSALTKYLKQTVLIQN